jgi:hypothetical protein
MGVAALAFGGKSHRENRFDASGRILHRLFKNLAGNPINRGNEAESVG